MVTVSSLELVCSIFENCIDGKALLLGNYINIIESIFNSARVSRMIESLSGILYGIEDQGMLDADSDNNNVNLIKLIIRSTRYLYNSYSNIDTTITMGSTY
jgi:hypothetical protein